MINNVIYTSIKRSIAILPKGYGVKSMYLFFGIIINSFFDIIGLAAILPILAATLKPGFILENKYTSALYNYLQFSEVNYFIVFLCLIIVLFILGKNLFGIWIQKKQAEFCWQVHEEVSSSVLNKAYQRGFLFFTQNNSNRLLNRISGVPSLFAQNLILQIIQFLNEATILLIVISSLMIYDVLILVILAVVVLPFFTIFYQTNKKRVAESHERINQLAPLIAQPIFEIVFGFVDVVIGGVFENFKSRFLNHIAEAKKLRIKLLVIQSIPNRLIEICVILSIITMLLYGLFILSDIPKILTLLSIFGLAAYRTIPSINRLLLATINIKGQQFTLDVIEEMLQDKSENIADAADVPFKNEIRIENISFKFPDSSQQVLQSVSLTINKGDAVGIIGKSGSGKTTLMNIILGFLKPTEGNILIDGVPLKEKNIPSWQRNIGYVRQDVFLVDGNVLENVAFGISKEKIDVKAFEIAIERARLTEFVQQLPEKEYTKIGERGAKISGGQRQRIGIARALYHGAEVLCFDEATSALDSETEEEITEAIRSLHSTDLTMIIIAHRKSTLKYCDRILDINSLKQADTVKEK